jgi:hypothetical protein
MVIILIFGIVKEIFAGRAGRSNQLEIAQETKFLAQ